MSMGKDKQSQSSVVSRRDRYLNGPEGVVVLESLEEGESFIIQASGHSLLVTKRDGRAVVALMSSNLNMVSTETR